MVNIEHLNPGVPIAGPYTPVIKAGNLLFISGQIADQGIEEVREQTTNVLEKINFLLESCNVALKNLIKVNVYLTNIEDFQEMNEAYRAFFLKYGVKENFPTRTTIQAQPPIKGFCIEIDAIAVL